MAESRMNLAALQQRDPYIVHIDDTASQVALYSFSAQSNEWERTSIEGSLFVYQRSAEPTHGFMILNRLGLNNLIEPITKELEFQQQDPFLLYRNTKNIHGIWFYETSDCERIGKMMNSYVQSALEAHVSKSKQIQMERKDLPVDPQKGPPQNVDIMQMLSKAREEYVKTKDPVSKQVDSNPKPFIDNPNAAASKASNIIKPKPLKMSLKDAGGGDMASPTTAPITLDTLFKSASQQQQSQKHDLPKPPAMHRSISVSEAERHLIRRSENEDYPPLLKHIMSSTSSASSGCTTLEQIEAGNFDKARESKSRKIAVSPQNAQTSKSSSISTQDSGPLFCHPSLKSLPNIHSNGDGISTQRHSKSPLSLYSESERQQTEVKNVSRSMQGQCDTQGSTYQMSMPSEKGDSDNFMRNDLLTPNALDPSNMTIKGERPPSTGKNITDVLLTPMAFETLVNKTSPVPMDTHKTSEEPPMDRPLGSSGSDALPVAALTREQLQQAMLYLIKNDANFLNQLHEAYLSSLRELAMFKK